MTSTSDRLSPGLTAARSVPVDGAPEPSLGALVSAATRDLSTLVHKEIQLAKTEIKGDAVAAGKGVGLFGAAGFVGLLSLIFLSIALAHGIAGLGLPLGVGFLIVGVLYVLLAGVLALVGKRSLGRVSPPRRTIATVKDDLAWVKHPTVDPSRGTAPGAAPGALTTRT